jgi:hypothetical protein
MTHWRELQDSDYLRAVDLKGRDVTLTIEKVVGGKITGTGGKKSKKPLCYFKEGRDPKPLGLNSTNCKAIAAMYGDQVEQWSGKRITLYPTKTDFGGETVDCIRVRPQRPAERNNRAAPAQPAPEQSTADAPDDDPIASEPGPPEDYPS